MRAYRVYFLDKGAHISRPPVIIECADDQQAIAKAKTLLDGQTIELWRDDYLVEIFAPK
jgi:hypothetical protein